MGLFSNNKKPCPICGEATPRLLATKIADKTPICSDCSRKISMADKQVDELSAEGLKEHLALREENAKYLESSFRANRKIPVGYTNLNIDGANKVFTIPLNMCGDTKNPPVFQFGELEGYELRGDSGLVERFDKGDPAPQFIPLVYRPMVVFREKDEKPQNETYGFTLILYLSNPCWDKVESSAGSVSAGAHYIHHEINSHLEQLRVVTEALTEIMGSGGKAGGVQSSADSTVGDIKKFKELLDGGIITQEEFDAKKKQLLGI